MTYLALIVACLALWAGRRGGRLDEQRRSLALRHERDRAVQFAQQIRDEARNFVEHKR